MAWTEITRRKYRREGRRYASDMTDGEWGLIEPLMPGRRRLGRPRTTELREVVNAILYLASGGNSWRALPKDFPAGGAGLLLRLGQGWHLAQDQPRSGDGGA